MSTKIKTLWNNHYQIGKWLKFTWKGISAVIKEEKEILNNIK